MGSVRDRALTAEARGSSGARALRAALAAIVAAGILIRVIAWGQRRSLWFDEILLVLNVLRKSPAALMRPLELEQSAPPGFLLLQKLAVSLGGASELAIRFFPLLAGIALLPVAWWALKRLVPAPAALMAVGLIAFSQFILRYATEAKHYGFEILAATMIVGVTAWTLDHHEDRRAPAFLAATGIVAVLFSFTAIFVLAGCGTALLISAASRRDRSSTRNVVVCGATWLLAFGLLYVLFVRHAAASAFFHAMWERTFLAPDAPDLAERAVLLVRSLVPATILGDSQRLLPASARTPITVFGLAAMLCGVWSVLRANRAKGAVLVAPLLFLLAANVVRQYPISPRHSLFLMPVMAALFASGLWTCAAWIAAHLHIRPLALAVFGIWLLPIQFSAQRVLRPQMIEHSRPVIARILAQRGAEPVYVPARALPAWLFYTTDWSRPDTARVERIVELVHDGPAFFAHPPRGRPMEPGEGDALIGRVGEGTEIYGLASGFFRGGMTVFHPAPDSGWADNEVRRLRAASSPCGWTLRAHYFPPEFDAFQASIAKAGGREVLALDNGIIEARAARVCFGS